MNRREEMKPAFPPRYYSVRLRGWVWLCLPVGFLGTFAVGFIYVLCMGAGGIFQVLGLVWVIWMIRGIFRAHIEAWREARLFPYYDERLPDADTFLTGQAVLRNCLRLDRLAESKGTKSISAFGFPDALRWQKVKWHDASEGLKTISCLIQAVIEEPDSVDDSSAVLSDLEKIRYAFERAAEEGIKFSFLIEEMGGTNGMVWERRGGWP